MWLTADFDYAAAFAQLYDYKMLLQCSVALNDNEILDLTRCGLDVAAVAAALTDAGLPSQRAEDDADHSNRLLWRLSDGAIRAAGYRAVRLREWSDWGAGRRHTVSLCLSDLSAIVSREAIALPSLNFQFPADSTQTPPLSAPHGGSPTDIEDNH